jgi:ribosomal protein S13
MDFFKKIQKLDVVYKKLIVVALTVALGIPLGFFVAKNFQKRMEEFKKEKFLKELNFPKVKEEIKGTLPIEKIKETKTKLEEELKKVEKLKNQFSTSTTSTNNQQFYER